MKRININSEGRMPLWQVDLRWMQSSYTEVLQALVKELGITLDYFAITGCSPYKPDNKRLQMDAGWFWWNGDILPVRALPATSVVNFANPVVRLTRKTYYNPDGGRPFIHADLSSLYVDDVWQDDYLEPTVVERAAVFTSGVRLAPDAWTLHDILATRESQWHNSFSGDLQYKVIGRMVVLKGIATDISLDITPVDRGLPKPIGGEARLTVPSDPNSFDIRITSNGELICQSRGGYGEPTLTGMTYMTETPMNITDPNTINDHPIQGGGGNIGGNV